MPFPESPRVLYGKTPLTVVICQVRFPPVLKIESQVPAGFQERIRATYPLLDEANEVPAGLPPEVARLMGMALTEKGRKEWKFLSEDRQWAAVLARDFVALTTDHYSRWEEFRQHLALLLEALDVEYHPSFATRVGLRYQNLIVRSELNLDGVPWSELLMPHIAAEYCSAEIADEIQEVSRRVVIELEEQTGLAHLRHGSARQQGEDEQAYSLDADLFAAEKMEIPDVLARLDVFNRVAARLFRWCITERLHNAMEPALVPA